MTEKPVNPVNQLVSQYYNLSQYMKMLYMVTFTINIPQMLAYIPAPWILWVYAIEFL